MTTRRSLTGPAILALALLLTGGPAGDRAQAQQPKRGGVLTVADPRSDDHPEPWCSSSSVVDRPRASPAADVAN